MWKWASLFVLMVPSLAFAAPWEQVRCEAGITSWKREGEPLPTYRARTTLNASVWEALAVLDDVDRACEWTSHCAEMRRVETVSERELLVYARMDAPWPVRDRDVFVRVTVEYGGSGEVLVQIRATQDRELQAKQAVRMPCSPRSIAFGRTGIVRTWSISWSSIRAVRCPTG
jgi:hypothetical protein